MITDRTFLELLYLCDFIYLSRNFREFSILTHSVIASDSVTMCYIFLEL